MSREATKGLIPHDQLTAMYGQTQRGSDDPNSVTGGVDAQSDGSIPTSQWTLEETPHSRQRAEERGFNKKHVQGLLKHGTATPAREGRTILQDDNWTAVVQMPDTSDVHRSNHGRPVAVTGYSNGWLGFHVFFASVLSPPLSQTHVYFYLLKF